jgi:hypothetical protein
VEVGYKENAIPLIGPALQVKAKEKSVHRLKFEV